MKVTMAQELKIFLCEHCASVHIGLYRNGKMFAEAIPNDAGAVLEEMMLAVAESNHRQEPLGRKH